MGKSAPAAPDYTQAAQAQADSSREVTEQQTWANRPTINTPFGQQTWETTPTWDPATQQYLNSWTQNTNLTPESQSALDSQMRLQQGRSNLAESLLGRSQKEYGDTMDWSQFDKLAGTPQGQNYKTEDLQRQLSTNGMQAVDPSQAYYNKAGDAVYNQWSNRQEPRMQQELEGARTRLYNQGLKEGDEAFDREMQRMRQDQDDARGQAQNQATITSGQEAQRMYGMDSGTRQQQFGERQAQGAFANSAANQAMNQNLAAGQANFGQGMQQANYQNTLRQQQIAETMQQRGFSLNEINAIISGQQVGMPSMPGFQNAQRSEGVQSLSAAQMQGQHDLDAFNAQQQATQGMMQGGMSAAMMFSDRRLKKNIIEWTYDAVLGLQTYFFNYIWDKDGAPLRYGFMAQEVERLYPDCVTNILGFKAVDYRRLGRG